MTNPGEQPSAVLERRSYAIVLAIGAAVCLPLGDAMAKSLTLLYPVFVIAWARFFVTTIVVGTAGRWRLTNLVSTQLPHWQLIRAALAVATTLFYYEGLRTLPLAHCTAIMFLAPLWAVGMARIWLGEAVSSVQYGAVALSLVGTALIMQPDRGDLQWTVLLPIAGSVTLGGFLVITRRLALVDSALTTTFLTAAITLICFTAVLPLYWVPISDSSDLSQLVAIGLLGAVGQQWTVMAYRHAPTAVVAPLGYLSLVIAVVMGWYFFDQAPHMVSAIGMSCVVLSGLGLILHRPTHAPVCPGRTNNAAD